LQLNVQAQAKIADFISRLPHTAEKHAPWLVLREKPSFLGLYCQKSLLLWCSSAVAAAETAPVASASK